MHLKSRKAVAVLDWFRARSFCPVVLTILVFAGSPDAAHACLPIPFDPASDSSEVVLLGRVGQVTASAYQDRATVDIKVVLAGRYPGKTLTLSYATGAPPGPPSPCPQHYAASLRRGDPLVVYLDRLTGKLEPRHWLSVSEAIRSNDGRVRRLFAVPDEPVPPQIANPVWERRPTPRDLARHYPVKARSGRIEGRSTLRCMVTHAGGLAQCAIVSEEPRGAGFSAAALVVSKRFKMGVRDREGLLTAGREVTVPTSWRLP